MMDKVLGKRVPGEVIRANLGPYSRVQGEVELMLLVITPEGFL